MKQKLNYLMIAIAIALMGGTSCSSDDNPSTSEGTKDVTVTIGLGKMGSKAMGESAKDVIPDVKDLTLYFTDGAETVVSTQNFPVGLTNSGEIVNSDKKTFSVPSSAIAVYAVGNTSAIAGSINLPNVVIGSTTRTEVESSLINISKQTDPETAINVRSEISVLSPPVGGTEGNYTATIALKPAVARIEIQEVKSDATVNIPLSSFKLTGIYINNTYTHFGLDQKTKGTEVKYGKTIQDASAWAYGGSFPAFLKDEPSRVGESLGIAGNGVSYIPSANQGDVWGYFVASTIENTFPYDPSKPGTIIDGNQYDAVPHIILKIEDATANNTTIPSTQYVTIRSFKTTGGSPVTKLEAGNYYLIKSINIGGEHLASNPEDTNIKIDVTVTVLKWNEIEIEPNL